MPVVSLSGDGVAESSGNYLNFVVTLDEASDTDIRIDYRLRGNGTAYDDDTYNGYTSSSVNGSIMVPAGTTTADIFVRAWDDSTDEADEAVVLELFGLRGDATFEGGRPTLSAFGFLLDTDGSAVPNLAFHVSDPILIEGDGGNKQAVFAVHLSRPAPSEVRASYETVDGSATAGSDYSARSGTLVFGAGQEVAYVRVPVSGDTTPEQTETFDLVLAQLSGPTVSMAGAVGTAEIRDNDTGDGPVISLEGDAVMEGTGNYLRFVVSLDGPSDTDVAVQYRLLGNGTATDSDFYHGYASSSSNGTVTIAAGETSTSVYVRLWDESEDEADESIVLQLYDPSGNANFAGGETTLSALGIILDSDGSLTPNLAFHVSDPVVTEGDNGSKEALFAVHLSRPAPSRIEASYETQAGSASAGSDFTAQSGNLVFEPGQEVAYVSVPILGDKTPEATEFFDLVVTQTAGTTVSTEGAVGTAEIRDNDTGTGPVISLKGDGVLEASGNYLRFVVSLDAPSDSDVTVNYRLRGNGTAENSDTYYGYTSNSVNGSVTIAAGATTANVFVRAWDESEDEADEAIVMELYDPSGAASFAGGENTLSAFGFLWDSDGNVTRDLAIHVSDPILVEGDDGRKQAEFAIHLSRPAESQIEASYHTVDGTAVAKQDYLKRSGTLVFEEGQQVAYVRVPVIGDGLSELTETFDLVVEHTAGPSIGTDGAVGTATILDDDSEIGPVISLAGDSVTEGTGNYLRFVVSLDEASDTDISVNYRLRSNGTAEDADIYNSFTSSASTGTVTIAAGDTSANVFVRLWDESEDEADESLMLELYDPSGNARFAGGQPTLAALGFIRDSDGNITPDLALAGADVSFQENYRNAIVVEVPVELSQISRSDQSFEVRAVNGSAIEGRDFEVLDEEIHFAAGQTVTGVRVKILPDVKVEGNEGFTLHFDHSAGSAFSGEATAINVDIRNFQVFTKGDDEVSLSNRAEKVNALGGNDSVKAGGGHDQVNGAGGKDLLRGDKGNDTLQGGGGSDELHGDKGNDELRGQKGADYLNGGKGNDILTGDASADTFYFKKGDGKDVITDFQIGRDMIEIGKGAKRINQLDFEQQGDDVSVSFQNVEITVQDVTLDALQDIDNFLF